MMEELYEVSEEVGLKINRWKTKTVTEPEDIGELFRTSRTRGN